MAPLELGRWSALNAALPHFGQGGGRGAVGGDRESGGAESERQPRLRGPTGVKVGAENLWLVVEPLVVESPLRRTLCGKFTRNQIS
jgi:hypothetical protein